MRSKFLIVLISLLMTSCVTSQNEKYFYIITLRQPKDLIKIAKKFGTTSHKILRDNSTNWKRLRPNIKLKLYVNRRFVDAIGGKARPLAVPNGKYRRNIFAGIGQGQLRWPVRAKISSQFGKRGSRWHEGVDLKARGGTPIYAVAPGKVTFSGWQRGYGRIIEIYHDEFDLITRYAHCRRLKVRKGQRVRSGQNIATVGRSGRATGNHLHFEVRNGNKVALNPLAFLSSNQRVADAQ